MTKNSDLEKWEYREHTKVKHVLLKKYLAAWIPILGRWYPKICYFDGFAGRGEYTDGTLGSPLIALEVADGLNQYFGELICFLLKKMLRILGILQRSWNENNQRLEIFKK